MPRLPALRFHGLPPRFRDDQSGATAVEFGLLALPFCFLVVAILEIAMVFWSSQALETAVANASRELYTGQFQRDEENKKLSSEDLRTKMKDKICAHVPTLFDCKASVSVDVQTYDNFSSAATMSPPVDAANKYDPSKFGYKSPAPNQVSVVRASMEYPLLASMLRTQGSLANGNRLVMATSTFLTEPYPTN